MKQMERLKLAFDEERHELEDRIKHLQKELEDVQAQSLRENAFDMEQLKRRQRDQLKQHQSEVEELNNTNMKLKQLNNTVWVSAK